MLRLRRARTDERQQLRWIAYAAVPWAIAFAAAAPVPDAWSLAANLIYVLAVAGFTVALALAVLRRRLYEVDLLIGKTVVYGGLAAFVTLAYTALVVGIGTLVGSQGVPSPWLSLVATAVVAVAFQPARERVQRVANRLVYGRRASPYEVLAGFSRRVAGALSAEEVLPRLAEAATRGVGATRGRVRLFLPDGTDVVSRWPATPAVGPDAPFDRTVTVAHQGEPVGEIAVATVAGEPLAPAEGKLLDDLAAQAGMALRNARLTAELRARLAELAGQAEALRASRQRIVVAQDSARRRLERDIHDGAQRHLVALAVSARLVRQLMETDPSRAAALLDDLEAQANEALATLRDLPRGIFPTLLADRGLVVALTAHINRTRPATRLECDPRLDDARFAPDLEAGVYFCCLEALQNAAKHAPGAGATLRLAAENGSLVFSLRDDGPGFEAPPSGSPRGAGLLNMADRMAALGGTLAIESAPGQGTTITGRGPLLPDSRPAPPSKQTTRLREVVLSTSRPSAHHQD